MNYSEEQDNEIEALKSIYDVDFNEVMDEDRNNREFSISLKSQSEDQSVQVKCSLNFRYSPTYPDVIPEFAITDNVNIDLEQIESLLDILKSTAEENLGMVMIFSLVSEVQEAINNYSDELTERHLAEEEQKLKEEEERNKKKFHGTPVTVKSFVTWKLKFDEEMNVREKISEFKEKKLTGREMFLRDHNLDDSDITFLKEEPVEVDESLFEELDDLDLEDEMSEES